MSSHKLVAVAVIASLAVTGICYAQRFGGGGRNGGLYSVRQPQPDSFNGAFTFCRLAQPEAPDGEGGGWGVDYPRADENLSIRLSELTKTPINHDEEGNPNHFVLTANDPALFDCPFVMLTEPGGDYIGEPEALALRNYLLKGGFLWADDFWGSYQWDHWVRELRKVLPADEYPIVDLPLNHEIFHSLFDVKKIPQIPSIGHWEGTGTTSERGADSAEPHARAILDAKGRVMVLITHNTDFGDAYEREGDDPAYFYRFSVDGYAIGIDVLLYAMSH